MGKLGHYIESLERATEDSFTKYVPGSKKSLELLSVAANFKETKFKRVVALLSLARELVPVAPDPEQNRKYFRDISELPISPEAYSFKDKIGEGGENEVYLLESNQPEKRSSLVFKISHYRRGKPQELSKMAKQQVEEYERIRRIYEDIPSVVPKEAVMIARDVRSFFIKKGRPVIITVQKFFGGEIRDFFREISFEELKQLIIQEPEFAETVRKFVAASLRHEKETGEVADFLGPKNLSVVKTGNSHSLILLDPHTIHSSHSGVKEKDERLDKALEYLKTVGEAAK